MTDRAARAVIRRIEHATAAALHRTAPTRLLVAASGGPDSAAALLALHERAAARCWQLEAAHFDHGIAPPELRASFRATAEALASRCGLPLHCAGADVPRLAAGVGLEGAARRARYAFLDRLAREREMDAVVVGHTMDDQAETVLLHLIRGSGIDGLAGMRPRSPLPESADPAAAPLIRPLLGVRRRETIGLCRAFRLDFVEDPANRDLTHLRNCLRLEVLPALAAWNPRITEALAGLAAGATLDRELLEALTDQAVSELTRDTAPASAGITISRRSLRAHPPALQARVLRRLVAAVGGGAPSHERTQALLRLLERGGHQVECGRRTVAEAHGDQLHIGARHDAPDRSPHNRGELVK